MKKYYYLILLSIIQINSTELVIHSEDPAIVTIKNAEGKISPLMHQAIQLAKTKNYDEVVKPGDYEINHYATRGLNFEEDEEVHFKVPNQKEYDLWLCTNNSTNKECLEGNKIDLKFCTKEGKDCDPKTKKEIESRSAKDKTLYITEYYTPKP